MYESPWLNLTLYPDEADYPRARPLGDSWLNLQSSVRATDAPWELPPVLAEREGPLVYLSLGSLGSADVELMQRLVDTLADGAVPRDRLQGPRSTSCCGCPRRWRARSSCPRPRSSRRSTP